MKTYFKIIDFEDGKIKTLFHGVGGTRILLRQKWIDADIKMVSNGTGGIEYKSGFHLFKTRMEAVDYLKYFTNIKNKRIISCKAKNLRKKTHSRNDVFLAASIYIS